MLPFKVIGVKNTSKHTVLGEQIILANNPWLRLKGLLGFHQLPESYGLWLTPCNSIHMFFMSIALDVVFLDKDLFVIEILEDFRPWHVSKIYPKAKHVLELPVGVVQHTKTSIGDQLIMHIEN